MNFRIRTVRVGFLKFDVPGEGGQEAEELLVGGEGFGDGIVEPAGPFAGGAGNLTAGLDRQFDEAGAAAQAELAGLTWVNHDRARMQTRRQAWTASRLEAAPSVGTGGWEQRKGACSGAMSRLLYQQRTKKRGLPLTMRRNRVAGQLQTGQQSSFRMASARSSSCSPNANWGLGWFMNQHADRTKFL